MAAPVPEAPPPVRRSSFVRIGLALGLVALLLAMALPAALLASLRSEAGTAWWLTRLPGLQVDAPRGSLLGGDFAAERLRLLLGSGDVLVLEQAAWQGLDISRSEDAGTWVALRLARLQAGKATYTPAPRPAAPPTPLSAPASLRLPVTLRIDALTLGEFHSPLIGAQPVRGIAGRLELGAEGGARHRLDGLQLAWDRLAAQGRLQIDSDAPMAVLAELQLSPAAPPGAAASAPSAAAAQPAQAPGLPALDDWRADLRLSGPLAQPTLRASARRTGTTGAPLLDATAGLRPFAAWPLADVLARTQGLDLAAFASAAPRTALDGEATVRASGLDQAASADIRLSNAAAGLWNEGRLPLRTLALRLQARPDQPQVATIDQLEAELGSAGRPAGRLQGRGGIDHGRWQVDAVLDGVMPQGLDARAAAMNLSGSVSAEGQPLDGGTAASAAASAPPGPRPGAAPPSRAASGAAGVGGVGAGPGPGKSTTAGQQIRLRTALTGRLTAAAARPTRAVPRTRSPARNAPAVAEAGARSSPALSLDLDAQARLGAAGQLQLEFTQAALRSGGARAQFSGTVARDGDNAPWAVKAKALLAEFDPRPWWPGADGSAWRRGPHRLNAEADVDLRWTAPAATATAASRPAANADAGRTVADPTAELLASLAPLRGQATLQLGPSLLAGVPLEGRAELQARGAERGNPDVEATLALSGAGNRAKATLSARADRPAADRWTAEIDAPALAALGPAAAMLGLLPEEAAAAGTGSRRGAGTAARARSGAPARVGDAAAPRVTAEAAPRVTAEAAPRVTAEAAPRVTAEAAPRAAGTAPGLAGRLTVQATATGRWPTVQTGGQLAADGLRLGDLALQRGTVRWQLGTQADAPAQIEAALSRLAVAGQTADALTLRLDGSARTHRLSLDVDSKAVAAAPASGSGPSPARLTLRAEGGLQFGGGSGLAASGWRGRVQELNALSGSSEAAAIGLRSREVALDIGWGGGQPARLAVQPGRLELQAGPTQAALRWSRLSWQAAPPGGEMRLDAEAELEPLAVAPLLARLQPDFGWGGNLEIGGKLLVQTLPTLRADIVVERRRGDLSVTDETGTQALGLSDLRLALNADNGVWSFTQALAGSTVGVAAGAVVARPGSASTWPGPNTPVQGVVELRVANLGAWGPWVPAGWRLGGALRTSASIGGRLGAPEYTGEIRGNGLTVRNFAEGVNVADGEVAVQLQGSTARIDTFSAKAGNGSVSISGGASFGSAPKASLSLRAEQFQLLGRVDRRIVASGNGQLQLEADKIALDGQFKVDEGLVDFTRGDAPSLSDDVTVVRPAKSASQAEAQRSDEQKAGAAASRLGSEAETARRSGTGPAAGKPVPNRSVALNLGVNLGDRLRLRGRGLDTGLRGELRITSPGGKLAVNGTVSTQDGTYQAYGQRLTIDRGSIIFTGAVENPRLDIEATRPNTDVKVGVTVAGTATNPRVRLFSEPDLPEVDKLSWLVLGRATDGLGRTETALLQRAALALLAGEGEGATDRMTRAIGLDEVSLRQTDGAVRETVISLGKQLSRRWYVGYERGLNTTTGSWQLIYRIAQRLTLRAQSGLENSVDMIWTWRWR